MIDFTCVRLVVSFNHRKYKKKKIQKIQKNTEKYKKKPPAPLNRVRYLPYVNYPKVISRFQQTQLYLRRTNQPTSPIRGGRTKNEKSNPNYAKHHTSVWQQLACSLYLTCNPLLYMQTNRSRTKRFRVLDSHAMLLLLTYRAILCLHQQFP